MVALVLGLVLLAGVINIFVTTRQTFRVNENLAHMQESSRLAFELLVREVRESGSMPCGTRAMANVVRVAGAIPWWADWTAGTTRGFNGDQNSDPGMAVFGTATARRVAGTDAILSLRIASDELKVKLVTSHDPAAMLFDVPSTAGYDVGDMMAACDVASGALLQVGVVNTTPTFQIGYDSATAPLNCSTDLGYPTAGCGAGIAKTFLAGAVLSAYDPVFWYIGVNPRGSRSLYRRNAVTGGGVTSLEMVTGVQDMQLEYLTRDAANGDLLATTWVDAADPVFAPGVGGWTTANTNQAVAVRITLTLRSEESVGSNGQPLERRFAAVAGLRARELP